MTENICKNIILTVGRCDWITNTETCTTVGNTCSDFNIGLIEDFCVDKGPDFTKKCTLSNGDCIEKTEETDKSQSQGSQTGNEEDTQKSGAYNLNSKMLFVFLFLFFL